MRSDRASRRTIGFASDRLQRIGTALEREIANGTLPGCVVAIARRGELTGGKDRKGGLSKRQLMQLARFHSRRRDANATLVKVNFRPRQAGRLTAP